ncbi:Fe-S-containing protein [Granulicella mallensis]|uniref:Iron permease FTR1 n=1 Tax=Granulicella mallensis (strain ATCC BAA-1857 / DSM 23137 / MP5ACTX8) TaxID=682795 RepID=G8NYE6_GRAMM|nr:Fe-S-containing protein [Granulicella mallensis]AEU37912.1 iron permease FTR1 [Granulicella mallensis MP5ACTX8]
MLQAFIITLREGVEAALIVGIIFAYLDKIDRRELKKTAFVALLSAVAASIGVAIVISRTQFNEDIFEGWVMLVAAAFVIGMIWFMHKTARSMKGEIESKVAKLTSNRFGLFMFVFLMVLREGVETVLILAGVSLNSTELMSFTGTLLGIGAAVVFGVLFIRGSVRINLQRFFRVTTIILYFVVFQLLVSGLHELSENGVLPSSTTEMRYIGPIVRNDLFFFVTMLALAGLMVLFEYRRRAPQVVPTDATPADRRKLEWTAKRERLWMTSVIIISFLFIFLSTAEFIYAQSSTALSAATPVTLVGSQVTVPTADINDAKLHRYAVHIDGDGKSTEVRFLLFRKPDGNLVAAADACSICGPVGFYIGEQGITCKMCSSPLVASSMGQPGGCNPIPLKSTIEGGMIVIARADLEPLVKVFGK